MKPSAVPSLQSHKHRSEHWIVVGGTAKITIDSVVKLVTEGESIHVPLVLLIVWEMLVIYR